MRYILKYIRRYPGLLLLNLLGSMAFVINNLGLPTVFARMINQAIIPGDLDRLLYWGGVMLALIIVTNLGRIGLNYSSSLLSSRMIRDLRRDIYDKIQYYSPEEYEQIGVSSLITRIVTDCFILMQFTDMGLRIGFNTPLMFLGSCIMIFRMNIRLAWVVMAGLPFVLAVILFIAHRTQPLSHKQQASLDELNQLSRESLNGLRVIRAYAREAFQFDKFKRASERYRENAQALYTTMGASQPLFFHILIWIIVLVILFALRPLEVMHLSLGDLVAFIEYAFHVLFSVLMFSQVFMMYPRMQVSTERIAAVLDIPLSIDLNPEGVRQATGPGVVEFDHVTFGYPGETENPVIEDIQLTARPGETVALIGSTGSGKSTLIQLLPRFYDVTFGRIRVDGVDVRDYYLPALRERIGFIPQKATLFTGTIAENLRYGRAEATDDELWEALSIAQAEDFVRALPDGLETELAEGGTNLSGGQKQRLSIARAIVRRPAIYIFDDSFSALDYRTDAKLRQAMQQELNDATILIVAQRVSTIQHADQIIVLDEGRIAGRGTHDELMQSNQIYREIAKSQHMLAEEATV